MNPGPSEFVLAAPPGAQAPADVWSNLDMAAITASLNDTGVWAPADQAAGLKALVADAAADGHDLHLVVLDQTYPKFTAYRDIATELQSQVGGTVLVFGPSGSGTASSEFSRVDLEDASTSVTKGSDATSAATQMYHSVTDPNVNWNGVTIGLILVVIIGAVIARLMTKRRRRAEAADAERTDDAASIEVEKDASADAR
ncbi:Rv1476 family membrane protein [Gordonia hydrophobica]|uniref:DUF6676 family protein n=1 Tax=Gordonia hydrophobica TaxID=40516 RepID=A0ABZ2TZX5_9ACTN|nr:DUF6676 family protein [Gordonia hydrophobica]MBM7369162.1 hypothetical protein [Gordonia hydrophobica]